MKNKLIIKCLMLVLLNILFVFTGCEFVPVNQPSKLDAPVISLNGAMATWDLDPNCMGYEADINGEIIKLSSYDDYIILQSGETIKLRAIGDGSYFLNSDWSNEVKYSTSEDKPIDGELTLGEKIKAEYQDLKSGKSSKHTTWTITGEVVALECKLNSTYNNYYLNAIVNIDNVLIGIYSGQVNSSYPTSVDNLAVGSILTATGVISENYTLTVGEVYTEIEFSKPEVSWEGMPNNDDDKGDFNSVNFFMINDTHGAFTDSGDAYSIGRVDTILEQIEAKNGDYIKIHCGDAFQGSFISGEMYGLPLIEAFNELEFDCFVLGNHEFDWGLDKIEQYADGDLSNGEANFPFLGANIFYKGTTTRPDWIDPYAIIEYGDIEVGVIGIMGDTHESSILTSMVEDYEFVSSIGIVEELAAELRTEKGCEVVVVATHDYDSYWNSVIASFDGDSIVDGIFCAHTHQYVNESQLRSDGVFIPVVQNYHKNNLAVGVQLYYDESYNLAEFNNTFYYPSNYQISDEINQLINKYSDLIADSQYVLGTTDRSISKGALGNHAVQSMIDHEYQGFNFDDVDVSIINSGGIRATIGSGEITKSDVFEVFPFNNQIVLVNMTGKSIKSLLSGNSNYLYYLVGDEYGSYEYLDDNTIYQIAVIDYVFEGERYSEFNNLKEEDFIYTGILLRDLMITYLDELYN